MPGRAFPIMGNMGGPGIGPKPGVTGIGQLLLRCLSPQTGPGASGHPRGPELPASSADMVSALAGLKVHGERQATSKQAYKSGYNSDKRCEAS